MIAIFYVFLIWMDVRIYRWWWKYFINTKQRWWGITDVATFLKHYGIEVNEENSNDQSFYLWSNIFVDKVIRTAYSKNFHLKEALLECWTIMCLWFKINLPRYFPWKRNEIKDNCWIQFFSIILRKLDSV